jgi:glycosyltransferase involved in cell wall biosynthesis
VEISVIITNYNYGKYVARAIRSVLNQSFHRDEYEVIVIDDCSTDNSKSVIESFSGHVKAMYNDKNLGLAASCNKAIRAAMGKYVIRLDADDYVHKDWLLILHAYLAHNKDMDAVSTDYTEVDEKENILKRKCGITWPIACSVMYRTDQIIQLGLYDETLPREDFEFRKRFLEAKYQIYNIPVPLYRYTMHSNSLSKQ